MKKHGSQHLTILLVMISCLLSACQAPGLSATNPTPDTGKIEGKFFTLTAQIEHPIANATIQLGIIRSDKIYIAGETITDAQGHYSFDGVAPGTYTMPTVLWERKEEGICPSGSTTFAGKPLHSGWLIEAAEKRTDNSPIWFGIPNVDKFEVMAGNVIQTNIVLKCD